MLPSSSGDGRHNRQGVEMASTGRRNEQVRVEVPGGLVKHLDICSTAETHENGWLSDDSIEAFMATVDEPALATV